MNIVKKTVYCEGKTDKVFLDRLFKRYGVPITVVETGGIRGLNAVASFDSEQRKAKNFIVVRDRDFRIRPPLNQQLTREKNVCTLARTCIENYVFETTMIRNWWRDQSGQVGWAFGTAPGEERIEEWIKLGVKTIEAYQITRWSLASLVPGDGFPPIRSTWSKKLPMDISEEACLREARHMITRFVSSKEGLESRFADCFEEFKKIFQAPNFLENKDYLLWVSGKDLKAALGGINLIPQGSIPAYNTYMYAAADYLDISKHPDLEELVRVARELC